MPNEIITLKRIARAVLPRLVENLVMPQLVNSDFSAEFTQKQGDTIQIKKPVILEAKDFDEATGVTTQPVKEESVEVKLDKIATIDIEVGAQEGATKFDDLNRLFLEPAAVALAEKINTTGLSLYKDIPYLSGTAGTAISTVADIVAIRKILNDNKVPNTDRKFIFGSDTEANLLALDKFSDVDKSGSTQALRDASLGRLYGFDNYMSQSVQTHTKGTLATAGTAGKKILLKGAATKATSITIDTDDSALTGTLVKGDILTIGTKVVTVTEDATAEDNEITVNIYPALTATDNSEVVIKANHTANLAFHPMAFTFVNRPLDIAPGTDCYVTSYNGVSLRVTRAYDFNKKKTYMSMDVLYNYTTIYPELAVRVMG